MKRMWTISRIENFKNAVFKIFNNTKMTLKSLKTKNKKIKSHVRRLQIKNLANILYLKYDILKNYPKNTYKLKIQKII